MSWGPQYYGGPPGGGYQQPPPAAGYYQGYGGRPPPQTGGYQQPYQQSSLPPGGYQQAPYNPGPPPPTSYGGGPSAPGGYGVPPPSRSPPGIDPTIWEWFQTVDADKSGQISAIELRQALVNSNWTHFNDETCRLLIGMFDKDQNGTIDVYEFGALWKYVQEWKGCFDRFDTDNSGNISAHELQQALLAFGYRLSIHFCQLCTRLFDRADKNSMKFDDFIQCCVKLRTLTESFQKMDTDRDGMIDISYEQFLEMAVGNI